MDKVKKVKKSLAERIKEKGYTKKAFYEAVGISKPALDSLLKKESEPRMKTIDKILEVLDCKYEDVFSE